MFKFLKIIAYLLIGIAVLSSVIFSILYLNKFGAAEISNNPHDWTATIQFLAGLITPLTALLSVLLILHINGIGHSIIVDQTKLNRAKIRSDLLEKDIELLDDVWNLFQTFSYYNKTLISDNFYEISKSISVITKRRKAIITSWKSEGFINSLNSFKSAISTMVQSYDEHLFSQETFTPGDLLTVEQRDNLRDIRSLFSSNKGTAFIFLERFSQTIYEEYEKALKECIDK